MAIVNRVDKRVQMDRKDTVRFQILTHCYLQHISISEADLACLTLLAIEGEQELTSFCQLVADEKIFRSNQTVRNAIAKAEKKNLIVKAGNSKKRVLINPDMKIQTEGTILLDYKIVSLA